MKKKIVPNRLPKEPKVIKIDPSKHHEVGSGYYATVYRLSPRRVVKVFQNHVPKYVVSSEIEGSKVSKYALPVLKVVKVKFKNESECWRLVKKYIPHEVSRDESDFLKSKLRLESEKAKKLCFDCHEYNVRRDNKGKLWMIDTQLELW